MTFMQEESGEFEEVRQHHDAFVERGRLELMAEELRTRTGGEGPGYSERHIQATDSV